MSDNEVYRLRKEVEYLRDYIEQQRKRHAADIKTLRDDLYQETRYSKKLRAELEEEYKHCEKLRKQLEDRKRLGKDLRDELDDERLYSEKLERKLDKRAKVIKELEADLLDLEDEYAEARRALKCLDQLKCEAKNAEIYRSYCKQRINQLQDENHSLRSTSRTSSPSYAPAALHYTASRGTPQTQVHVITNSPHLRVPSPRPQPPTAIRSRLRTPPASTPSLESDYSEYEGEEQDDDARLTEDDDVKEEVAEAEADVAEYSDAEEEFVTPGTNRTPEDADADVDADVDVDAAPGQKLRELAAKEGLLADREYERSREAYARGDHAFAKKLKDTGAQHRNNMRNYNRLAAAEIFTRHNPEYNTNPRARGKIDLHHLRVREAREFVENHIQLCRRAGLGSTDIISGRGNHSAGGVAKIRPAVMEYLESQQDVEVDPRGTNPGRIVVRFLDTGRPEPAEDDGARQRRRSVRPGAGGPEHSDVDDVFEHGRTRLKAAMRTADEVRQGVDEIEHGMNTLRIKPETRRGLRDISNRT